MAEIGTLTVRIKTRGFRRVIWQLSLLRAWYALWGYKRLPCAARKRALRIIAAGFKISAEAKD